MTVDDDLLYKISTAYYDDGLTQREIGSRYGLSRIKVSRLLQQARQNGMVQITIVQPKASHVDLERALEAKYGLNEVVVVPTRSDRRADMPSALGPAAARYLARCVGDHEVVAISWGTTLAGMADALQTQNLSEVRVVQMLGGLGRPESEFYGAELTLRFAQALGGRARLVPSPGVVSSKIVRDALLTDEAIAETLALAASADIAFVGIGSPIPGSVVLESGILTEHDLDELHAAGAVGDIALRFFDANGRPVNHPLNDRIVGLDLEQISCLPRVVAIAGGSDKFDVIRGAVRGHLIDVLITDERTASRLVVER
jgi:DNA-binding transcriptional regulator LsrR (DeoR family)